MQNTNRLSLLLNELEQELMAQHLWETLSPAADALASLMPFALDKLSPTQWLQWIFIPKMRFLLKEGIALRSRLSISPYLVEALCHQEKEKLLAITEQIDAIFLESADD